MSFLNKVTIVTGASSGIGAATAILFAKEEANVVMVGRNQTKLDNVAAKVSSFGKEPLIINADVTKKNEAERIIKETVDKYGKIDILVNNAGVIKLGNILEGNIIQAYDNVMNVNLRAVINLTTLATPHLVASKGNIVNISSCSSVSVSSISNYLPYSMSKAALDKFTLGAALELASSGVRVNSVNPGPVYTDLIENSNIKDLDIETVKSTMPLKRVSDPVEIAELITYLAGEKAKGITGSIFFADNGCSLVI